MGLPIRDVVYSPVLAAVKGFFDHYEPDEFAREDSPVDLLTDFIGACVNKCGTDYAQAIRLIKKRRHERDEDAPQPATGVTAGTIQEVGDTAEEGIELGVAAADEDAPGQLVPVSGDRRGTIHMIWMDHITELIGDDFGKLAEDITRARMAQRFGQALTEDGINVNSANDDCSINGLPTPEAKRRITEWLAKGGAGKPAVQYKLRDWLFSRQRYWGEPFPILHDPNGNVAPVPEDDLPVELPPMEDFKPESVDNDATPPRPPLGRAPGSWQQVERDGVTYQRELNTMPQWAGSCWYYLRFCDPHNAERFVGRDAERYWMGGSGIDLYVGGAEHAVLHLLYSRFWHHVLHDLGHVSTPEPFGKLFNQGYIQAYAYTDGRGIHVPVDDVEEKDGGFYYNGEPVDRQLGKMGKSLKNAITPDEVREKYGCDTLRLYEMYLGPLEQSKLWRTRDIVGVHRFLQRLWRNFIDDETGELLVHDVQPDEGLNRKLHKTIKRVTDDMHRMSFHTAIAALIELNNDLVALEKLPLDVAECLVLMLAPFAPHIAEELWQRMGYEESLTYESWPVHDDALLVEETAEYPVQVNGKLRGRVAVPADADDEAIERAAFAHEKVRAAIADLEIKKVVVVKGRMVNIVAK